LENAAGQAKWKRDVPFKTRLSGFTLSLRSPLPGASLLTAFGPFGAPFPLFAPPFGFRLQAAWIGPLIFVLKELDLGVLLAMGSRGGERRGENWTVWAGRGDS
jgi:hypothetical protein